MVNTGRYYTINGQKYPSVTTILSVLNKPFLLEWAVAQAFEKMTQDPQFTASLLLTQPQALKKFFGSAADEVRDEAAEVGRGFHEEAAHSLQTGIETVAGNRVSQLLSELSLTHTYSEVVVHSRTHSYAGTLDILALDQKGQHVVIDIKTGRSVHLEHFLQVSAYASAEFLADTFMPPVAYGLIFHIREASTVYHVNVHELFPTFLAALNLFRFAESFKPSAYKIITIQPPSQSSADK